MMIQKTFLIGFFKKFRYNLFSFFIGLLVQAQGNPIIDKQEIVRIETELASDKMEGRAIFTPGIELASAFIENEFKKIGLSYFKDLKNYRQEFIAEGKAANNVIGILFGKSKPEEFVIFSAHYDHIGVVKNGEDKVYNGANDDA